jgi:hypothetical protein
MPVGTRQVKFFFRDSSKLKLEFLAVNTKLPPIAYVYPFFCNHMWTNPKQRMIGHWPSLPA